jgi:hypothetical protein
MQLGKATELDPRMPEAYRNRGILYILTKKNELAIVNYKKILELT